MTGFCAVVFLTLQAFTNSHGAAIVTTFRHEPFLEGNWSSVLNFWFTWHIEKLQFRYVYLFCDSVSSYTFLQQYKQNESAANFRDSIVLIQAPHSHTNHDDLHEFISRQVRNCNDGYQQARAARVKWLFHIDVDELIWLPNNSSINHLISWLDEHKIGMINFMNHEGIPEQVDMNNYFESVKYFRPHLSLLGLSGTYFSQPNNLISKLGLRSYFVSYANGKSAVRVMPFGEPANSKNHFWDLPEWMQTQGFKSVTNIILHGKGEYWNEATDRVQLLHYVSCGYLFWKDKYALLGNFPDAYNQQQDIPFDSHLRSRDVVIAAQETSARTFYESTFVVQPKKLDEMKHHGFAVLFDVAPQSQNENTAVPERDEL
eukprot:c6696_g1_i1.p1 GENE.c6696_g1_i1~~c6696_g1_i1.p1  ORF type:complete len:372 (-),score=58.23 c6696_g1_i1:18-1133(-)